MTEDQMLIAITVNTALEKLEPPYRTMMTLIYALNQPADWEASWPPRLEDIGVYVGLRYGGKPLSEAAIRYRRDMVLAAWAADRTKLRRVTNNPDV